MKSFITMVFVALFFVLALIFGARNEQVVTINYFIAKGEYRLPVVFAVIFIAGFLLSWIVASYYLVKLKLSYRQASKKIIRLEAKLAKQNTPDVKAIGVDKNKAITA